MRVYRFIVTLGAAAQHSDDLADALFEAGCDDGTLWSTGSVVQVGFSREAESLEAAIRSAIADVVKTGQTVTEMTLEAAALAALPE